MVNSNASDLEIAHQCLVEAIQNEHPIVEIESMIEKRPEVVVTHGYNYVLTPWEEPIKVTRSDSRLGSLLQVMIKHYPDVVKTRGWYGTLMLHDFLDRTMFRSASDDKAANEKVVECLVNTYPEALMIRDENGELPIDIALRGIKVHATTAFGILEFMMKTCPKALSSQDSYGYTSIHSLDDWTGMISTAKDRILMLVLEHCPEALECDRPDTGERPLKSIIMYAWRHLSVPTLRLLWQKWPEGLQVTDRDGDLPLHSVCRGDESTFWSDDAMPFWGTDISEWIELIDFMAAEWKEALDTEGRDGLLPFELLMMRLGAPRDDDVALVARFIPAACSNPFYAVCKSSLANATNFQHDWSMDSYLLRFLYYDKASRFRRDPSTGNLPLHELLLIRPQQKALHLYLKMWPESAKEPDGKGRLPLQLLLRNWVSDVYSWPKLKLLVDSCPQVVTNAEVEGDEAGFLPWQVAAIYTSSVGIVYELLRLYPESFEQSRWARDSSNAITLKQQGVE